jgi:hypothetical protein
MKKPTPIAEITASLSITPEGAFITAYYVTEDAHLFLTNECRKYAITVIDYELTPGVWFKLHPGYNPQAVLDYILAYNGGSGDKE